MGFKKSHIYKVLAKKSKFESIITHWRRIINKNSFDQDITETGSEHSENVEVLEIFVQENSVTLSQVLPVAHVCPQ